MLTSIIFHIADPWSLPYGQTIKDIGQLQEIQLYLEQCRDKNCMIFIFKIEKLKFPMIEDYSPVVISLTV